MQVRLTRKLADQIDGIDLAGRVVGDLIDLPAADARLIIAEGWAIPAAEPRKPEPPGRNDPPGRPPPRRHE